jgi:micrococcal nuclease
MKRVFVLVILLALTSLACLGSISAPPANDDAVKAALERLIAAATQTSLAEPTQIPVLTSTAMPIFTPTLAPSATPTLPEANIPAATVTGTLAPGGEGDLTAASASACLPAGVALEAGLVTKVVDGSTIQVFINGKTYTVRYIGVKFPAVWKFEKAAEKKNREMAEGQPVVLIKDTSGSDPDGRLLRYVLIGDLQGTFMNYELVRQGYAQAARTAPDLACADALGQAQIEAAKEESGIWEPGAGPSPTPKPTRAPDWMTAPEGSKVKAPGLCRPGCR